MVTKAKKTKVAAKKAPAKVKKTAKKVAAKKKTAKKVVKKAPAKAKKTAKKAPAKAVKKAPAKKKTAKVVKKAVAKKAPVKKVAAVKTPESPAKPAKKVVKKAKLSAKDKRIFKKRLVELRDRLSGQITSLKQKSLTRNDSVVSSEDGSDAFDRQFALNLVSSENDALFEIDEALRRLSWGTYGVCESCECIIKTPRLSALPFVRMCIECQSEKEKNPRGFEARRTF